MTTVASNTRPAPTPARARTAAPPSKGTRVARWDDIPPVKGWTQAANVFLGLGLSPTAILLRAWVLPLWIWAHRKRPYAPSLPTLRRWCHCGKRALASALTELKNYPLLKVESGKGRRRRNVYMLLNPPESMGAERTDKPNSIGAERTDKPSNQSVRSGPRTVVHGTTTENGKKRETARPSLSKPSASLARTEPPGTSLARIDSGKDSDGRTALTSRNPVSGQSYVADLKLLRGHLQDLDPLECSVIGQVGNRLTASEAQLGIIRGALLKVTKAKQREQETAAAHRQREVFDLLNGLLGQRLTSSEYLNEVNASDLSVTADDVRAALARFTEERRKKNHDVWFDEEAQAWIERALLNGEGPATEKQARKKTAENERAWRGLRNDLRRVVALDAAGHFKNPEPKSGLSASDALAALAAKTRSEVALIEIRTTLPPQCVLMFNKLYGDKHPS